MHRLLRSLLLVQIVFWLNCSGCAYANRMSDAEIRNLSPSDLLTLYEGEATWREDWAYTKKIKEAALSAYAFPAAEAEKIRAGKIWRGMTWEQLTLSWGPCLKKSTTTTALGTTEIWDYGFSGVVSDVYLHRGVVTGWTQARY